MAPAAAVSPTAAVALLTFSKVSINFKLICEFAEIEDVGVALPDCARRTPQSMI